MVLHNSKACSNQEEVMRQGFTHYSVDFWISMKFENCEFIQKSQQYQTILTYFMSGKTNAVKFCPFIEPMASGLWPLPLILIVCILAHIKINRCVIISTLSFVSVLRFSLCRSYLISIGSPRNIFFRIFSQS